jgi:hypothetical protein
MQHKQTIINLFNNNVKSKKINKKFNNNGFFICEKINDKYEKICFGKPFN